MPVQLQGRSELIRAPRELVFQMLSAMGQGQLPGPQADRAKLLSRQDNRLIVEFHTRVGRRSYRTVEEVTLYPPERITFSHLEGPLDASWEEFLLEDHPQGTLLRYQGQFDYRFPLFGWFIAHLYIKPRYNRLIRDHLAHLKAAAEARAARSHVFRAGAQG